MAVKAAVYQQGVKGSGPVNQGGNIRRTLGAPVGSAAPAVHMNHNVAAAGKFQFQRISGKIYLEVGAAPAAVAAALLIFQGDFLSGGCIGVIFTASGAVSVSGMPFLGTGGLLGRVLRQGVGVFRNLRHFFQGNVGAGVAHGEVGVLLGIVRSPVAAPAFRQAVVRNGEEHLTGIVRLDVVGVGIDLAGDGTAVADDLQAMPLVFLEAVVSLGQHRVGAPATLPA